MEKASNEKNITILPIDIRYLKEDCEIVYYITSNVAIPVLCEEIIEKNYCEIKCTNLYDGSIIKYEDIGYWE